jgi:peptidoglycan/xylan/chitin deacetylase (PgdA/CDA1 family)
MRIPGIKTAKLLSRWLQGRLSGGALILGYHRIADTNSDEDEYEICVTPSHFAEHLDILRKHTHPMHLTEMVHHLKSGALPRKSVAITFDDGYADNLYNAGPLLEQQQIPATVFVSTDYLGGEFWWDELEHLLMAPPELPHSLQLTIHGEPFEWSALQSSKMLNDREDQSIRRKLNELLYFHLLPLETEFRKDVLNHLKSWSGAQAQNATARRALTTAELQELAKSGLIDIGAHTKTHPVLTRLPAEQQREEIQGSKAFLEALLGKPVLGFAYPHGKFSEETQAIVEAAGYLFACSSQQELAWQIQQSYTLPRIWPKDWDGKRFDRMIRFWLGN